MSLPKYPPDVLERARKVLEDLPLTPGSDFVASQSTLALHLTHEQSAERVFWVARLRELGFSDAAQVLDSNLREQSSTTLRACLLEAIRVKPWVLRLCSLCGYALTFKYVQGRFGFDSGCDCSRDPEGWTPRMESEIDYYLDPAHGHLQAVYFHIRSCGITPPTQVGVVVVPGHEIPDPSIPRH